MPSADRVPGCLACVMASASRAAITHGPVATCQRTALVAAANQRDRGDEPRPQLPPLCTRFLGLLHLNTVRSPPSSLALLMSGLNWLHGPCSAALHLRNLADGRPDQAMAFSSVAWSVDRCWGLENGEASLTPNRHVPACFSLKTFNQSRNSLPHGVASASEHNPSSMIGPVHWSDKAPGASHRMQVFQFPSHPVTISVSMALRVSVQSSISALCWLCSLGRCNARLLILLLLLLAS